MLSPALLVILAAGQDPPSPDPAVDLAEAARVASLAFTGPELEMMLADVRQRQEVFRSLRQAPVSNGDGPATVFNPFLPGMESRARSYRVMAPLGPMPMASVDPARLYWLDIPALSQLIEGRHITCVEVAEIFLDRLEAVDEHLHCVISLRRDQALARAAELDKELDLGQWRGPLHGIPWGAKDLLATRDSRTTWGAQPYREQVLDLDATVVQRLDEAGAVLIAKLSLGALAMGDRWFGERTRTPWDTEQGSSGSSAGSAAAVAAGALPFTIGSETLGSIVSPSVQCGTTALRPTFGRVPRHGAMTLCWSMDKLGPMARSATDLALVMTVIQGPDGHDPSVRDVPFAWAGRLELRGLRVGYPRGAFGDQPLEDGTLAELASHGVELVAVDLPVFDFGAVLLILAVEAASAFDDFTLSGMDDELVAQGRNAWPNFFRSARLIPGVEFLRAQRLRTQLMRDMHTSMAEVDFLVHPPFAAGILGMTNLTGHPTLILPCGEPDPEGPAAPRMICFTGQLDDDARLLGLGTAWQLATSHEEQRPPMEWLAR